MSGTEPIGGATLVKMGVAVIQRVAPKGIALVKSWLKGKEVVVIGQARAGKTTLLDYLQYGLFEDEIYRDKTLDVTQSARFNIKMGRDSSLELSVKTVVDVPGQIGPVAHADLVFDRSPHAVIILTDLTTPLRGEPDRASASWLLEFCKRLESRWRVKGKRGNRIKSIIVVMNKNDKADKRRVEAREREFRRILNSELKEARGKMIKEIAIMPCILVTNSGGTKLVDSIVAHLAKSLTK